MSTPEAQRRARTEYRKRQKEAGAKLVSFMLSPEAQERLAKLAAAHKLSKAKALEFAIMEAPMNVGVVGPGDSVRVVTEWPVETQKPKAQKAKGVVLASPKPAPQARRSTKASDGEGRQTDCEAIGRPTEPLVQLGPAPVTPGSRLKGGKK